jgi:hypothetical protein
MWTRLIIVIIIIINNYNKSDMHATRAIAWEHTAHTNGTHKNNNDNISTPIFIGLNKTAQKSRTPQEENGARKDKE